MYRQVKAYGYELPATRRRKRRAELQHVGQDYRLEYGLVREGALQ